ncbi:MAG: response regulator [Candidatus Omnitrophota bacterium]
MDKQIYKVLLIEDNYADASLVQEILREDDAAKYELQYTNRLEKGLECLGREPFDVLLLDLGLKESEGLETLKKIKSHHPQIPTIVLTAFDDAGTGSCAIKEGAGDFLVKGLTTGEKLKGSIRNLVKSKNT